MSPKNSEIRAIKTVVLRSKLSDQYNDQKISRV
jgi:hypothetical protein